MAAAAPRYSMQLPPTSLRPASLATGGSQGSTGLGFMTDAQLVESCERLSASSRWMAMLLDQLHQEKTELLNTRNSLNARITQIKSCWPAKEAENPPASPWLSSKTIPVPSIPFQVPPRPVDAAVGESSPSSRPAVSDKSTANGEVKSSGGSAVPSNATPGAIPPLPVAAANPVSGPTTPLSTHSSQPITSGVAPVRVEEEAIQEVLSAPEELVALVEPSGVVRLTWFYDEQVLEQLIDPQHPLRTVSFEIRQQSLAANGRMRTRTYACDCRAPPSAGDVPEQSFMVQGCVPGRLYELSVRALARLSTGELLVSPFSSPPTVVGGEHANQVLSLTSPVNSRAGSLAPAKSEEAQGQCPESTPEKAVRPEIPFSPAKHSPPAVFGVLERSGLVGKALRAQSPPAGEEDKIGPRQLDFLSPVRSVREDEKATPGPIDFQRSVRVVRDSPPAVSCAVETGPLLQRSYEAVPVHRAQESQQPPEWSREAVSAVRSLDAAPRLQSRGTAQAQSGAARPRALDGLKQSHSVEVTAAAATRGNEPQERDWLAMANQRPVFDNLAASAPIRLSQNSSSRNTQDSQQPTRDAPQRGDAQQRSSLDALRSSCPPNDARLSQDTRAQRWQQESHASTRQRSLETPVGRHGQEGSPNVTAAAAVAAVTRVQEERPGHHSPVLRVQPHRGEAQASRQHSARPGAPLQPQTAASPQQKTRHVSAAEAVERWAQQHSTRPTLLSPERGSIVLTHTSDQSAGLDTRTHPVGALRQQHRQQQRQPQLQGREASHNRRFPPDGVASRQGRSPTGSAVIPTTPPWRVTAQAATPNQSQGQSMSSSSGPSRQPPRQHPETGQQVAQRQQPGRSLAAQAKPGDHVPPGMSMRSTHPQPPVNQTSNPLLNCRSFPPQLPSRGVAAECGGMQAPQQQMPVVAERRLPQAQSFPAQITPTWASVQDTGSPPPHAAAGHYGAGAGYPHSHAQTRGPSQDLAWRNPYPALTQERFLFSPCNAELEHLEPPPPRRRSFYQEGEQSDLDVRAQLDCAAPEVPFRDRALQPPSPAPGPQPDRGILHNLRIQIAEGRWEVLEFHGGCGLQEAADAFMRQHHVHNAFREGLVAKMLQMATSGARQSNVDIVDLI